MIIKVEAMIREEKLEDVLDALAALDVHGMTCYQVMGCGTQRGFKEYAYVRGHQQVEIQKYWFRQKNGRRKLLMPFRRQPIPVISATARSLAMMCGRQCESAPRKPAMMRFSRNKRAI